MVALHRRYADAVAFVSVSIDDAQDHDKLRRVAAQLKLPYPVALDPTGKVLAKYASGASIPLTFVIDAQGSVAYRHGNYEPGDEAALQAAIEKVVASP